MDKVQRFIDGAIENAKAAKVASLIKFKVGDCRDMDKFFKSVDKIVTNPPYGVRLGTERYVRSLYRKFLDSASKVLSEKGKICFITLKAGVFRNLVFMQKDFQIIEERVVGLGGLYPSVFLLEKIS